MLQSRMKAAVLWRNMVSHNVFPYHRNYTNLSLPVLGGANHEKERNKKNGKTVLHIGAAALLTFAAVNSSNRSAVEGPKLSQQRGGLWASASYRLLHCWVGWREWVLTSTDIIANALGSMQRRGCVSSAASCCGIVGYVGHQPAEPFLREGILILQNRDYDSCGNMHPQRL